MEILKQGIWAKKIDCRDCKSVFKVQEADIRYGLYSSEYEQEFEGQCYVTCPVCGKERVLKSIPTPIKERVMKERAD